MAQYNSNCILNLAKSLSLEIPGVISSLVRGVADFFFSVKTHAISELSTPPSTP